MNIPTAETFLMLDGPAGQLELLFTPNKNNSNKIAIICHPHPLYGGTMHNKVVYTTAKALQRLDFSTICFNYRGVGKSSGTYGGGEGEAEDLLAIIKWLEKVLPNHELWLAGFSFGAYVSFKVASIHGCQQLISIAPAIHHHDYQKYLPITMPWLLIQGMADEIVPANLVIDWAENLEFPPKIITLPEASHFFHGKLTILRDILIENLKSNSL